MPVDQTKGKATRERLLALAGRAFAERGYAATSYASLIEASGLTKGAFYFHFASKADLALAVLDEQEQRWLREVHDVVLAHPSAAQQLDAVGRATIELVVTDPSAWSITALCHELAADPRYAARAAAPMAQWVALLARVIESGQRSGEFREDVDAAALATALVAAVDGLKSLTRTLAVAGDPVDATPLVEALGALATTTRAGLQPR